MSSRRADDQSPNDLIPAMFLATTYDKSSEAWTASSPTPLVSLLIFRIRCTHPVLVIPQLECHQIPLVFRLSFSA